MPVKTIDVSEARTHFDDLLSTVEAGTEIVIEKGEKPIARLIPISPPLKKRTPGLGKGEGWISDDFDDPLPDDFWLGDNGSPL